MALQKDARVTIGVDGAQEVSRALGAVSDSVHGIVSDLGHVVTAAGAISFAGAIQQAHALEESVARIGVAANRSVDSAQAGVNQLARQIGELPQEVAAWTSSVGRLTHSYEGAAQAAKGLKEYAALTGESFQEVQQLGAALQIVGHVAGDTSRAIGVIAAQADKLSTVGGPQAIGDAFVHLQGQLSQLANSQDVGKVTALLGGFGGARLTAPQRERALGAVLSRVEGNPEGFERFLGHRITDEEGHIKDVTGVLADLAKYGRRGRGQQKRLLFTFGAETAAAVVNTDFGAIREAEGVAPSETPAERQRRLQQTPAGERRQAQINKDISMQGLVGHGTFLGDLSDAFGRFAGDHPIGALLGASLGTRLLGKGIKGLPTFLRGAGALARSGTAAAETVATEEGLLGSGALSSFSSAGAGEGVVDLVSGGALGSVGVAASPFLGGGFFLYKLLRSIARAQERQYGFKDSYEIGADEAASLSQQAREAEQVAPEKRSPGVQAALELEQARIARARAARAEAAAPLPEAALATAPLARQSAAALAPLPGAQHAPANDALFKSTVDQLVKAGASLALAQETAAALLRDPRTPVQIMVINATGGTIDAQIRGKQ